MPLAEKTGMTLNSKLFRGDTALEACQVRDSAHIVEGARGPHVTKIQSAMVTLEGAAIESAEIDMAIYGRSTAAAVLEYKRARKIVNPAYQNQADNIVGKMTITRLDADVAEAERRTCGRCCPDPVRGGPPASALATAQFAIGETVRQFPALLATVFQLVRVNGQVGPTAFQLFRDLPPRANELLAPFGQRVAAVAGFSFSSPKKTAFDDISRIEGIRRQAEAAMPNLKKVLRVIVIPFCSSSDDAIDDTKNNAVSHGQATFIEGFENFMLLNANIIRPDRGTLLHEMIHCSRGDMMLESAHREEVAANIFSSSGIRNRLLPEHAAILQNADFSFRR